MVRITKLAAIVMLLANAGNVSAHVPAEGFANIVKPILPSVVSLAVTFKPQKNKALDGVPPQVLEEFAKRLPPGFAEEIIRRRGNKRPSHQGARGALGAGFVIEYDAAKKEAYIVTNDHIVEDVKDVKVLLPDGKGRQKEVKATIVGRDPRTDLALIKIKTKKPMQALKWADSDAAKVGDWAIAIGNPFGLGNTVTVGVISHNGRSIPHADFVDGFIQTDAAVNVGNSGGALCNTDREVVGVIVGRIIPGVGDGVSFAIPANVAKDTIAQLRKHGRTRRGWIGIGIQSLSEDIVRALKLKDSSGALVGSVTADGPAEKAGIRRGDVIMKIDDKSIRDSREVPRIIGNKQIGSTVRITVLRDGKEKTMSLVLGEYEKAEKEGRLALDSQGEEETKKSDDIYEEVGLSFANLTAENRKMYNISSNMKGVVVEQVDPDSEAFEKGIRAGDVLETINMKKVTTLKELQAIFKSVRERKESAVLVALNRQGNELPFITLTIESDKKD